MSFLRNIRLFPKNMNRMRFFSSGMNNDNELVDSPTFPGLVIAKPKRRPDETTEEKKARLLYQSRKRGMLENDLLLSTFASKYLQKFNDKQIAEYDRFGNSHRKHTIYNASDREFFLPVAQMNSRDNHVLMINEISNDWDLYNWALGVKPTPEDYNNNVFQLFKEHVQNAKRETRFRQPDLY